jgi:hypothetical protein
MPNFCFVWETEVLDVLTGGWSGQALAAGKCCG